MKVPDSASDIPTDTGLPGEHESYIPNRYADKDLLTRQEAIDLINHVSGALLADGNFRRHTPRTTPDQ